MNNFIQLPTEFTEGRKPQGAPVMAAQSAMRKSGDDRAKDALIRVFAFVGLVSILVFGTYAVVKYMPVAVRGISSTLSGLATESDTQGRQGGLTVTADRFILRSGEALNLSWAVDNNEGGSFTFSYPCLGGVYFDMMIMGTKDIAYCNVENRFLNEGNTLSLIGHSSPGTITEVPLKISFTPNGESRVGGFDTVRVTISNELANSVIAGSSETSVTSTTGGSDNTPRVASGAGSRAAGPRTETIRQIPTSSGIVTDGPQFIDLTARILTTGYIASSSTSDFIQADEIPSNLRGAVRFEITNVGTMATKEWRFNVVLPTFPSYIFHSDTQQPLLPGDRIEYMIAFDSIERQSEGTITINVDPTNSINEPNKSNNIIKGVVKIRIIN